MHLSQPSRRVLIALAVLAVAWFALLGARDLIEPDEGRYAEIPREMLVSGDWITPRLDGFKYFEKPPLQYWLTAIGFALFGLGNGTARLWPALLGFGGAAAAGWLAARLYGREAGHAAFGVLLSSLLYFVLGHGLTLDMTVSTTLLAGLVCLVMAQRERGRPASAYWMWGGWAALAAAMLAKGLIALVLPGAAVVLYSLWQRDWALWRHLRIGSGLLVFALLAAPWFVLVSLRNAEFAWFFFVHEHLLRFTTKVHHRYEPAWFFVPVLLLGTLPWTGAYLRALLRPPFPWRLRAGAAGDSGAAPGTFCAERLLWVFAAVVFLFFSASDSKLAPYILPMLAPLAILAAPRIAGRGERWVLPLALLAGIVLVALGLWLPHATLRRIPAESAARYGVWLVPAGVAMALAGAAWYGLRRRPPLKLFVTVLLSLVSLQMVVWAVRMIEPSYSSRALADAIRAEARPDTELYCIGDYYPQSLPFYLGRTCDLVHIADELKMGIDAEPGRWFPSVEAFAQHWREERSALAVMGKDYRDDFLRRGLPVRTVYEGPRLVVVSRY